MNAEAQRRALAASWKAASSVFTDEGYDEGSLNVVEVARVRGDLGKVEYSADGRDWLSSSKQRSKGLSQGVTTST